MLKGKKKMAKGDIEDISSEWSTKRVEETIKFIDKTGVMPRDNPFFKGDVNMRKAGIKFAYTAAEFSELTACSRDILHFGETHAKVMTDEGVRVVRLRKYQKKVLLQYRKFRFNVFLASRQCGKCITFDTLVYVPSPTDAEEWMAIPVFELFYALDESRKGLGDWLELQLYRALLWLKPRAGLEAAYPVAA